MNAEPSTNHPLQHLPVSASGHRATWPARAIRRVLTHGFADAGRLVCRRLADRCHEWRLGINTVGSIDGSDLGYAAESFGYQPIPYATLDLVLRRVETIAGGVFIDYGCGKGRAVIAAARLPFQTVIGVERSAELCAEARQNLRRARRHLRCSDTQIVNVDARDFVPPSDVSAAFFFNPFDSCVLQPVLARLQAANLASDRGLQIIYGLPKCRPDLLTQCDWLEPQYDLTDQVADWQRCVIYRTCTAIREPQGFAPETGGSR